MRNTKITPLYERLSHDKELSVTARAAKAQAEEIIFAELIYN